MTARLAAVALASLSLGCLAAPDLATSSLPALAVSPPVAVDAEQPAREPGLAALPDGTLVASGFWGPRRWSAHPPATVAAALGAPLLWRSRDAGATWERLDPGTPAEGALGNSDSDLAAAPDGTLYAAELTFLSAPPSTSIEEVAVTVGASEDGGDSWRWRTLAVGAKVDRPWVAVAPDGAAHVVWNDPDGVHHATSRDRGASWTEGPRAHPRGGAGSLAVGPAGEVAVRVIPLAASLSLVAPGADGVAVSTDGGARWRYHDLPGERGWPEAPNGEPTDGTHRWAEPVAFDAHGVLHAAWIEGEELLVARSRDLGATWATVPLAREPGSAPQYVSLRGGPHLAASWFTNHTGAVAARVAVVAWGDGAPASRVATVEDDVGGETGGEYLTMAWLPTGGLGVVVPAGRDGATWVEYRHVRAE